MWDRNCFNNAPYGMSYVPWQRWEELFCPEDALQKGTTFPSLVMPFVGKGGLCKCTR